MTEKQASTFVHFLHALPEPPLDALTNIAMFALLVQKHLPQFKATILEVLEMEKTFENENLKLNDCLVKNNATKSNKCNRCDYASSHAGHLREH